MELTDEQVEAAAKIIYEAAASTNRTQAYWENLGEKHKPIYRGAVMEAAPFMQMRWDMPTEEETNAVYREISQSGAFSVPAVTGTFVRTRNAALILKPVDPREAKIVGELLDRYESDVVTQLDRVAWAHTKALAIIAALDSE